MKFKVQLQKYGVLTWPDGREYKGSWLYGKQHGERMFMETNRRDRKWE